MAKPYKDYKAGETVELTFYSTSDLKVLCQLTQSPEEKDGSWVVQGRLIRNGKLDAEERRWVALTITPRYFVI